MCVEGYAFTKTYDPLAPDTPANDRHFEGQFIVTSGVNVVSDLLIWLLPFFSIARLQVDRRKKIGVAAVFGVGLLLGSKAPHSWSMSMANDFSLAHVSRALSALLGALNIMAALT